MTLTLNGAAVGLAPRKLGSTLGLRYAGTPQQGDAAVICLELSGGLWGPRARWGGAGRGRAGRGGAGQGAGAGAGARGRAPQAQATSHGARRRP
jgi:hypothetical protein